MNKIIASVGLVALGAANVQAQNSLVSPASKWWNVQATVRGFYDDNINANPHPTSQDRVWGFEVQPKIGIATGNEQTTFTADYAYAFLWYDKKPIGNTDKFDQDHTFNMMLAHAFSERYSIHVRDSFVIGQEPDALRNDAAFHTPFRVPGDNKVNNGAIVFNAEMTRLLGLEVGYENTWVNYADSLSTVDPGKNVNGGLVTNPSNSGLLDRIEQYPHIALKWTECPETTFSLGYQFGQVNYTGDEIISGPIPADPTSVVSDDRDVRSHTVYLGADHQFRPDFYGSVEVGGTYYDYYNINETSWGPYARLSLTYVYMQDSTLTVGFQEGRAATDVLGNPTSKSDIVRDAETSVVYANVHQKIIANLFGNLNGTFQNQTFKGGTLNNETEQYFEFGANLQYVFNPHISAHVGYDFDKLNSDISNRGYTRNKVYIGATASY